MSSPFRTVLLNDIVNGPCECGANVAQRASIKGQRFIGPCLNCGATVRITGTATLERQSNTSAF